MADELLKNSSMRGIFNIMSTVNRGIAFEYSEGGRVCTVSYAEYRDYCLGAAAALWGALGGKKGYVCLRQANSVEWGALFWGLLMAGCKPVLVEAKAGAETVEHILRQSGAIALVTPQPFKSTVPVVDPKDVLGKAAPKGFEPDWANEVAFCSSGTTRTPGIFCFSGEAVANQVQSARIMPTYTKDIMYPEQEGELKVLALLPFHHIFGFTAVFLWYTFFGKTIVFLQDLSPQVILSTCRKHRVTHIYGVPLLWLNVGRTLQRRAEKPGPLAPGLRRIVEYALAEAENHDPVRKLPVSKHFLSKVQKRTFGTQVRYMISGGGAISRQTLSLVNAMGYPLYNGYGLTECGVVAVELSPDAAERVQGSVGRPLTGVEFKLGEGGELLIGGAVMHTGVLEGGVLCPAETQGGYFHTGDLMRVDAAGKYHFTGRVKDIIVNAAGENILPDELEQHFLDLPYQTRLCLLGVQGSGTYEDITLMLELPELGTEELLKLRDAIFKINSSLPLYMQVKEVLVARSPIPVVNTIKVQRQKLKAMLERGEFPCDRLNMAGGLLSPKFVAAHPEVVARVRRVFAQVLGQEEDSIPNGAHFVYGLDGDSFLYAELIAQLEQEFGREIPADEYARCVCVADFARYLTRGE